jgi:hypothetical protein
MLILACVLSLELVTAVFLILVISEIPREIRAEFGSAETLGREQLPYAN